MLVDLGRYTAREGIFLNSDFHGIIRMFRASESGDLRKPIVRSEGVLNGHFVFGQSSGLVRTKHRDGTQSFHGLHVTYQGMMFGEAPGAHSQKHG